MLLGAQLQLAYEIEALQRFGRKARTLPPALETSPLLHCGLGSVWLPDGTKHQATVVFGIFADPSINTHT